MIKKSAIKSAFESLCREKVVHTTFGKFPVYSIGIGVVAVGRSFAVTLHKTFVFNGELRDWVCARSFPMSYKAAYRLVCSL